MASVVEALASDTGLGFGLAAAFSVEIETGSCFAVVTGRVEVVLGAAVVATTISDACGSSGVVVVGGATLIEGTSDELTS